MWVIQNNHTISDMPTHAEIMEFSETLAPMIGREVLADRRESRVALIGNEIIPVVLACRKAHSSRIWVLPNLKRSNCQRFDQTMGRTAPHLGHSWVTSSV